MGVPGQRWQAARKVGRAQARQRLDDQRKATSEIVETMIKLGLDPEHQAGRASPKLDDEDQFAMHNCRNVPWEQKPAVRL